MVGNNITIDARARKTASSLARAGFSVIALGVDPSGTAPGSESLDGALIHRVVPSMDSRVSTRLVRLSRAELRDSLRYRTEVQRQRLQMSRRNLTAWRRLQPHPDSRPSGVARTSILRIKTARVLLGQARFQATNNAYKLMARAPKRAWRRGSWRRDLPELHRYEAALGGIVDYLKPDLIHAHDVFHIGLAARAAARASERSETIRVVYDAHELIPGLPVDPRRRLAYTDLEEEYFHRVDAVVTVSDAMAGAIEARYGVRPSVVMNAPDLETSRPTKPLRTVVGLSDAVDLIAYVGGLAPSRGAEELLAAMEQLPSSVHLAFVSGPVNGYIADLARLADMRGLGDRVHFAPFVAPEEVVSYIESVDVSVIPLSREVQNYEVTLPNKLFQSIHAGVPVAVSDSPAMAAFVTEHQVGRVFAGGDPASMATAIAAILEDPSPFRMGLLDESLINEITWARQAENLIQVYRSVGVEVG